MPRPVKRSFTIADHGNGMPFGFQVELQAFSQVGFVFHNQNMTHASLSIPCRTGTQRFTRGNSSTTFVPRPSPSLSANTRPPCFRAIARTMKRPRPVPFT